MTTTVLMVPGATMAGRKDQSDHGTGECEEKPAPCRAEAAAGTVPVLTTCNVAGVGAHKVVRRAQTLSPKDDRAVVGPGNFSAVGMLDTSRKGCKEKNKQT